MANINLTLIIGHPLALVIPIQATATIDTAHQATTTVTATAQPPAPLSQPAVS